VHGAAEEAAEDDPQEGNGPPQCSCERAEDRAEPGDVEQLDQEDVRPRHRDEVDAVGLGVGRRLARRIGLEDTVDQHAIGEVAGDQDRDGDEE
jgi:hypothetical protein